MIDFSLNTCGNLKLRTQISLFGASLLALVLLLVYSIFILWGQHQQHKEGKYRIQQGLHTVAKVLSEQQRLEEQFSQENLNRLALQTGLDLYFLGESQQGRSAARTYFTVTEFPDILPVLRPGGQDQVLPDSTHTIYGVRLVLSQGDTAALFFRLAEVPDTQAALLRRSMLFVFLLSGVFCVPLAGLFIYHAISRPLAALIAAMKHIERKDWQPVEERCTTADFSALAQTFNRMAALIRQRDEQVHILSTAIEQSPIAVLLTDPQGCIHYLNAATEELTGYQAEELLGKKISILQSGQTPKEVYQQLWQIISKGQVWRGELLNKTKNGRVYWEALIISPIFTGEGQISHFVVSKEDIHECKQNREFLRRYEQILSVIADPMAFVDRHFVYQAVSTAYTQALGLTQEKILGRSVAELHGHDVIIQEKLTQCLQGEKIYYEAWLTFAQSYRRCMNISCFPFWDEKGTVSGIVMSFHDITALKVKEELLRESENRYRQIFDTNAAVKLIIDPENGQIVEANPAACRYYGYEAQTLLSMKITDINQLSRKEVQAAMHKAEKVQQMYFNFRHRLASGEIRDVEVYSGPLQSGNRTLLCSIIHDITEHKQAIEALWESNERLDLAVQGANLGTWDWNIDSGKVIYSERWAEMLGYRLQDVEPRVSFWEDLLHPDEQEGIMQAVNDHLAGRTPLYTVEQRLRHKKGHWVWVLASGKVFQRNDQGKAIRAVGIHLDISDRKRAEQQLCNAKDLAEAASHAKSVFLANMSHELRTPLNAILGYSQILVNDGNLHDKHLNSIRTIHKSGEHLLMLINDILDLSKIEAGKMELVTKEFRLESFLNGIVEIVKGRAMVKKIRLVYAPGPHLPAIIEADELRLRQVILNLLSNAVKFTQEGYCTLKVQSKNISHNKTLLTFIVEDSGSGIAPDVQPYIFESFRQTGERLQYAEGSGLGLAISQTLVRLMGGELRLISPLQAQPASGQGPGSRFFFTIGVRMLPQTKKPPQRLESPCLREQKRILLVDEKPSNRIVLRNILEVSGFQVHDLLHKRLLSEVYSRFRPDAVLMEFKGTQADKDLAASLRQQAPALPIIALAHSEVVEQSQESEYFAAWVLRPFSSVELLTVLNAQFAEPLPWVEERWPEEQEQGLTCPPSAVLDALYHLASGGDIFGLAQEVKELAQAEEGLYKDFSSKLEHLAENFQLNRIINLLETFRKRSQ